MQGFIIRLQRVKDEDLILAILTQERLETLYRFYGARHGTINLGHMIDFEIEHSLKSSIGRLYDVVHLGFPWLLDPARTRLWHTFVSLFYPHLRESEETGGFYFSLLKDAAERWGTQNPKRVAVEAYARLLHYEGRSPDRTHCFFCENPIDEASVCMIRAFQYAHTDCAHRTPVNKHAADELLKHQSALFLSDEEIDILWATLLEGF
ncbi:MULTISPECIES: recombination protein RecO [Sulfurimonadaceae]|uniref:recombination protein RecO n=1 Tax=Sulfurimonadaceae TaxID=2771471 RepID=UPI00210253EE|nr:recombination protein RecO [Sulfurimonas sp. HSL-3221]